MTEFDDIGNTRDLQRYYRFQVIKERYQEKGTLKNDADNQQVVSNQIWSPKSSGVLDYVAAFSDLKS